MKTWAIAFVVVFGAAELYQWVQGLTVPLPVFVVAGTLLAIASNANQPAGLPWKTSNGAIAAAPKSAHDIPSASLPPDLKASVISAVEPGVEPASAPAKPEPQLPLFDLHPRQRTISFTIRKPNQGKG